MPEPTTPATPQAGASGDPPTAPAATTPTPQAGAGKTPEDYERMLAELRHENAGHRTKLKSFEEAEALRLQAQMSELERAQKQAADLQERHDTIAAKLLESNVRQDVADKVDKFNFVVKARTIANFLLHDWDAIEFDDATGEPTNIEKLLEKLAKAEPDLVKKEQQQQQRPPNLPGMSPERSSIQQPGAGTPGKQPSWSDVKWSGR